MKIRHLIPIAGLVSTGVFAQRGGNGGGAPIGSLKAVAVPQPPGLERYVRDQGAAIALGKALFWDAQVGSDGRTACATCHFHAGADHRLRNQLSSPHDAVAAIRPNHILTAGEFPFHVLENPLDNRSAVLRDDRQVVGSAGVISRNFYDVVPGSAFDEGVETSGRNAFEIGGIKVRQVTPRNTPTVINSVFNVLNFWDGRASDIFTGATPFGDSDPGFHALGGSGRRLDRERVRIENASLASQAAGPALNDVEMSYGGRTWAKLGKKILALSPLAGQWVATDDSVLGGMANPESTGLLPEYGYDALIRAAFQPAYWGSALVVDSSGGVVEDVGSPRNSNEFTQMEFNFSLFWSLAIQAYEATLVSDDSRFDRFAEGNRAALTALEQLGMQEFQSGGSQCTQCHQGPEFTAASFTNRARRRPNGLNPDDFGFFRTGVSPISEDVGAGATDGFGIPLFPSARIGSANGVFKSPGLRNVEFTGPYFHDGGQATLEQVMEFYARQGDFPGGGNLGPGIGRIRLTAPERTALVAFMKALTDDRVRFERAPFDHPALCIPIGHGELAPGVLRVNDSNPGSPLTGSDDWALIPATGKDGNPVPLQTFEELLLGIGQDGSRAHSLAKSCVP